MARPVGWTGILAERSLGSPLALDRRGPSCDMRGVSELAWQYPIFMVIAIALGTYVYYWITRSARAPLPKEFDRTCPRCKLRTTGDSAKSYLYCPFCGAKYPPT